MSKSIKEVLYQFERSRKFNEDPRPRYDQALKEIEAIFAEAKPSGNRIDRLAYEAERIGYIGRSVADEYEANLLTALYGEED